MKRFITYMCRISVSVPNFAGFCFKLKFCYCDELFDTDTKVKQVQDSIGIDSSNSNP